MYAQNVRIIQRICKITSGSDSRIVFSALCFWAPACEQYNKRCLYFKLKTILINDRAQLDRPFDLFKKKTIKNQNDVVFRRFFYQFLKMAFSILEETENEKKKICEAIVVQNVVDKIETT